MSPLRSDEPAPRGSELAVRLAALVGGALEHAPAAHAEPVALATAHALAHKAKGFIYVQPEIARGELRVSADVFSVVSNVWDRVRQLAPAPVAHAFAAERIDAEVRGYLNPVAIASGKVERIRIEDRDVLALACADVDDDGALDIVTLGRYRAMMGRARDGRFVPTYSALLRDLADVAAAPLREPLASIVIVPRQGTEPAHVDLGITDRATGLQLDPGFKPRGWLSGVPLHIGGSDRCARFDGTVLAGYLQPCSVEAAPSAEEVSGPMPFDAMFEAMVIARDGRPHPVRASHNPVTNDLELDADGVRAVVPHTGAQVAVTDLDGDGDPEILSTLDPLPAPNPAASALRNPAERVEPDALVLLSWHPGEPPKERLRVPVPTGVRALAACPPDGAGPSALLLATAGELWIVR